MTIEPLPTASVDPAMELLCSLSSHVPASVELLAVDLGIAEFRVFELANQLRNRRIDLVVTADDITLHGPFGDRIGEHYFRRTHGY